MSLNESQNEAARAPDGPNLVLAGPGTGKTTTLVSRYVNLVERGFNPRRILAVTFTRKAANELKERIGEQTGYAATVFPIGTFHSLAFRWLREFGSEIGVPPDFEVLNESGQRSLLYANNIFWDAGDTGEDILDIIAHAKERLYEAATYRESVQAMRDRDEITDKDWRFEAADAFEAYETALRDGGYLDFSDLINRLVKGLEANPEIAQDLSGRFDHILVDELQDVNPGQIALLDKLLTTHRNIWAVGDDDQAIYSFRAADVGYILNFRDRFPDARVHQLDVNYRATPSILRPALSLIANNSNRWPKRLQTSQDGGARPVLAPFANERDEASWIAKAIEAYVDRNGAYSDCAVLVRIGHIAGHLQNVLNARNIPFELRGVRDFWSQTETQAVVGILRLVEDPTDTDAVSLLGNGKRAKIWQEKAGDLSRSDFATAAREAGRAVAQAAPKSMASDQKENFRRNAHTAARLAVEAGTLARLREEIAEQQARARNPGKDAVVLSTVHAAKGLEWPTVFMVGLEKEVCPHSSSEDIEEECRIAYVGLTRARRFLVASYVNERGGQPAGPSIFVKQAFASLPVEAYDFRGEEKDRPKPVGYRAGGRGYQSGGAIGREVGREKTRPEAWAQTSGRGAAVARSPGNDRQGAPWNQFEEFSAVSWAEDGQSLEGIARSLHRGTDEVRDLLTAKGIDFVEETKKAQV